VQEIELVKMVEFGKLHYWIEANAWGGFGDEAVKTKYLSHFLGISTSASLG
jgi:hypothetical protein